MRVLGLVLITASISACGGSTAGGAAPVDGGGTGGSGGFGGSSGGFGGIAGSSATGGVGGIGGGTPGTAQPPPPDPNAPPAAGNVPTTIAIRQIFLGETDWNGNSDPLAWKVYGYDVDGLVSTKDSAFHCMPKPGIPKSKIQTDGNGGIDNSFGSNLMPIIQNLNANPSASASDQYDSGQVGQLFHLVNLTPGGTNQNSINARSYQGASIPPPSWAGSDVWPVTYESVVGGDVAQPKLAFPSSYLVSGTWVSGAPTLGPLEIPLNFSGFPLPLRIRHVVVTAQLLPNGAVAQGIISGVLDTAELINDFKKVAGSFDPGLCDGPTFDSIAKQLEAASDIMKDGTQNPSQECDAISIGIGFEGNLVQLGSVAAPVPPIVDPCN
jgi:hypothetical protein